LRGVDSVGVIEKPVAVNTAHPVSTANSPAFHKGRRRRGGREIWGTSTAIGKENNGDMHTQIEHSIAVSSRLDGVIISV